MSDTDSMTTPKEGAWDSFSECWRRLPNKLFFFVLLAAWLALFKFSGNSTLGYFQSPSLFRYMWEIYNYRGSAADDALGEIIPFVVIGILWWKRRELLRLPFRLWSPSLLLVGTGLALHVAGYVLQEPRISIVAMFVGLFGLMGLAWGPAMLRHTFFPFFLFIFCVPFTEFVLPLTFPLRLFVSAATEWIAQFVLAIDVVRRGTELFDPLGTYQYDVAAACSGIRSLMAMFLLGTIVGFISFRSWWKRGILIILGVPLAVLGNLLRMLCIIIAAAMGGQSAGNYVHEGGPFGIISLVPYVPAILGILLSARWLEKVGSPNGESRVDAGRVAAEVMENRPSDQNLRRSQGSLKEV